MRIGPRWLINYIKNNGPKVIIPKEVTHIYGFGNVSETIETELGYKEGIEIIFEEESQIEEIGDRAFLRM